MELLGQSPLAWGPTGIGADSFSDQYLGPDGLQLEMVAGVDQVDTWVQIGIGHRGREGPQQLPMAGLWEWMATWEYSEHGGGVM